MPKNNLLIPIDYEWLKKLNPESLLDVRDVMQIFSYKKGSITSAIEQGNIQKEDELRVSKNGIRKRYWTVSTILKEIDRRINL